MPPARLSQVPVTKLVSAALSPGRSAHERQRELVRASLLACPARPRTPRPR